MSNLLLMGKMATNEYVGFTFFVGCMAMMAASVFFFFSILIFADLLLLLFSFFITDEFHKVIRNSGFIISTILIRISFSISGGLNNLLIISEITFGLLILVIHNKFEREISNESLKQ